MFGRAMQVKFVKANKTTAQTEADGINVNPETLKTIEDVRDLVVETVAGLALIGIVYKAADAACKIAVSNLSR